MAAAERAEFERRKRAQLARAALDLDHIDAEILRLLLQHPDITQQTIGDFVGLTRQQVNVRINAPKFQRALREANRSALDIVSANQAAAARRLGQLLHDPDPRVALRACLAHLWPLLRGRGPMADDEFARFLEEAASPEPVPERRTTP